MAVALPTQAAPTVASNAAGGLNLLADLDHEFQDYGAQLEDAKLGETRHPNDGRFYQREIGALVGMNRLADIDDVIRRAEAAAPVASVGFTTGGLLSFTARELLAHGHRTESVRMAERALKFYSGQAAGTKPTPAQRVAEATAFALAEKWNEAGAAFAKLAKDDPLTLEYQGWLGVIAARLGKADEARRVASALAAITRPNVLGEHQYERARVLAALGEGEAAVGALRQSFLLGQFWTNGRIHRDPAFEPIRSYPPFLEFLKPTG